VALRRHPDVAWQRIGDEAIVMSLSAGRVLGLNPTGALVWELVEQVPGQGPPHDRLRPAGRSEEPTLPSLAGDRGERGLRLRLDADDGCTVGAGRFGFRLHGDKRVERMLAEAGLAAGIRTPATGSGSRSIPRQNSPCLREVRVLSSTRV